VPLVPHNTNKGYNEMFDEIEATNDLAGFARELPEMLEKEGWADLSPADAQKRIDQYYESQLAGINSTPSPPTASS
jgi:hypothetical protein